MIGELVAKLIAAGTPPEVAASVVAEAFAAGVSSAPVRVTSRDESVTERRETDRLRKQRWRDRHGLSRDNRDMSRDVTNASLSKEDKKEEIKKEEEASQPAVSRSSRGHRLPDDWTPTPQDQAIAIELIGEDRTRAEFAKFRDHWKQQPGSKGVKLDWNAAWRNWIRRASEFRGGMHGDRTRNQGPTGHDAILAVAARKARELDRDDPVAGHAGAAGFAFGDGYQPGNPGGNRGASEAGSDDHHERQSDSQRVREGEIIPPDKDATGFSGRRQFV